ncbi:MAG TPA: TlpA disulfide reductase family protein [Anaerolineales bacterium]
MLTALMIGCQGQSAAIPVGPHPGELAPDFTVSLVGGKTLTRSDLRGQLFILNFWATWCGPCRREMPRLQALATNTTGDPPVVLAVNYGEDLDTVTTYLEEAGVTLPIALDPDLVMARDYLIFGMPTTFFVGRDGVVRNVYTGELTEAHLVELAAGIQRH